MRTKIQRTAATIMFVGMAGLSACGEDSPTDPRLDIEAVAGAYTMTALSFDPQGSLPAADILGELDQPPTLNLTTSGQAQILMRDPVTSLIVTINGTFQTTSTGVRIDFSDQSGIQELLLPTRLDLTFEETSGTLSFIGTAPNNGVERARLIELVPSLAGEQLLDPTPGTLAVQFTAD